MRYDTPLTQALKGRTKPKEETPLPQFSPPRTFEIHHHEIPGLPGRKVGEKLSVRLEGHVRSQHDTGTAMMHVSSVKPDTSEMIDSQYPEHKTSKDGVLSVQTQQSHV